MLFRPTFELPPNSKVSVLLTSNRVLPITFNHMIFHGTNHVTRI